MLKRFNPFLLLMAFVLMLVSCEKGEKDYTKYVDVFIGTQDDWNTFPVVSYPFGGVQHSPGTRLDPKAHKAYSYSDSLVYGFSHTHLNGVGEPEYNDILFMPFDASKMPKLPDNNFFAASFSHDKDHGEPGFHKIKVKYMQCGGGKSLKVSWQRDGGVKKSVINPAVLFH